MLKKFVDAKQISLWVESATAWTVAQVIISDMENGRLALNRPLIEQKL